MNASVYFIIAANLLPFAMVVGGEWGMREILPLYWFESAIIVSLFILKIFFLQGMTLAGKLLMAVRLTGHIVLFMFLHGFFLYKLLDGSIHGKTNEFDLVSLLMNVKWGILALFASHGVSFVLNYKRKDEILPFSRTLVMHLTIILGIGASLVFKTPEALVAVFVALKIFAEVMLHLKERAKLGTGQLEVAAGTGANHE